MKYIIVTMITKIYATCRRVAYIPVIIILYIYIYQINKRYILRLTMFILLWIINKRIKKNNNNNNE